MPPVILLVDTSLSCFIPGTLFGAFGSSLVTEQGTTRHDTPPHPVCTFSTEREVKASSNCAMCPARSFCREGTYQAKVRHTPRLPSFLRAHICVGGVRGVLVCLSRFRCPGCILKNDPPTSNHCRANTGAWERRYTGMSHLGLICALQAERYRGAYHTVHELLRSTLCAECTGRTT